MRNGHCLSTEYVKPICLPHHTSWGIHSQNLDVVSYHPLETSGHARTDAETCWEQSTESCGPQISLTKERVKHRVDLQGEVRISSHRLLQWPHRKGNVLQAEIYSIYKQFLQTCVSSPVQLLLYTGLGVDYSICGRHECLCGILFVQIINIYIFTNIFSL